MNNESYKNSMFVFPDPVIGPTYLSGAAFFYFKDKNIFFTTPTDIITTGSFRLLEMIKERRPSWNTIFTRIFNRWELSHSGFIRFLEEIEPLREYFKVIYFSYDAGSTAIENSDRLIKATGLSYEEVHSVIDPLHSSGEIIRHILLETYLELNEDLESLYEYCNELFVKKSLSHLHACAYFFRIPFLTENPGAPILLTNHKLTKFFNSLPIETKIKRNSEVLNDIIAWEFFRQILSKYIDPLNNKRAKRIAEILNNKADEIELFRNKCFKLAVEIERYDSPESLVSNVEKLIRTNAQKELSDLLELDKRTVRLFLNSLFEDEKTWMIFASTTFGMATEQSIFTTLGAISALSSIGAKAFKAIADRSKKLKQSDYTLVYTLNRTIK